jgi:Fe-Mn family superoxide dismutase
MRVHHQKHHTAYVKNLNSALEKYPELFERGLLELIKDLDSLPEAVRTAVRNNGGGHLNHSLFWQWMTPEKTSPSEKLLSALTQTFGGLDEFKQQFTAKALSHFGSGWAWLIQKDGVLEITSTSNQDSPYSTGAEVLLGLDVWEHAYYLKYRNLRADYISNWWNVVNWREVSSRFQDSVT